MLLPGSSPAIYVRADLVTNWYKRNLRILTNLNRVTEVGKDRVLLLIGSGHLAILRQLANDSTFSALWIRRRISNDQPSRRLPYFRIRPFRMRSSHVPKG
jgi:hypothetical protein